MSILKNDIAMRYLCGFKIFLLYIFLIFLFTGNCKKEGATQKIELPVLSTSGIGEISQTSANAYGDIISDGGSTLVERGICWSVSPTPTISDQKASAGNETGRYSIVMEGLQPESTYYFRAYATNSLGTAYGIILTFGTNGAVTDIDGNVYTTIKIGKQWWTKENLKVSRYRNGDAIPNITDRLEWEYTTSGGYCDYDNSIDTGRIYGHLYNWFTVNDNRGLAPTGWHVPTSEEFTALADYLTATLYGYKSTNNHVAKALAAESGWESDSIAGNIGNDQISNNSTRFTAFPGGCRYYNSSFLDIGRKCSFWSSTKNNPDDALIREMSYNSNHIYFGHHTKYLGLSIRCIRD
jgi:uncharacterized protein (TIGR02145 family)